MAKEWTLTEAFAHFGTRRSHKRQSWSARNELPNIVVIALWSDRFSWKDRPLSYGESEQPSLEGWDQRFGNRERMENLIWSRDRCDGIFRVVMVWAKSTTDPTREIASSAPRDDLIMRVTSLDDVTGKFSALRIV